VTDVTEPLRVLHLVGSATDGFHVELSRLYAADCLEVVADAERYEPMIALVTPDGRWRFADDLGDAALDAAEPMSRAQAVAHLDALRPDVAVPQMFCTSGMTDHRALLRWLGIPSVGNPPETMATAMDKAAARAVVAAAGVRVPEAQQVTSADEVTLDLPVVVKPVAADNSAGVTLVRDRADLPDAIDAARVHGPRVLVERYVELGREVRCGTVVHDGRLVALPVEEYDVDAATKPVRVADDKLGRDADGQLRLMAKDPIVDVDDPVTAVAGEAALACHRALGCTHHGLVDLRIDPEGRAWFLEAGPYCSFGRGSVVPTMARAAGIDTPTLFADAVALALHRGVDLPAGAR
jgi:D-alanine-D-alanine ligase